MQLRKPEVTIFADASHDDRARVAGWGAWIKADGHISVTCGAAMKSPVGSVTEAELCALANALTVARLRGLLATGRIVMLACASLADPYPQLLSELGHLMIPIPYDLPRGTLSGT
jgi:hypothetical protein